VPTQLLIIFEDLAHPNKWIIEPIEQLMQVSNVAFQKK
jgi:hypothetical protein